MADKHSHVDAIYIHSHWDDSVPPGSVDPEHRFATSRLLTPLTLACLRALLAVYYFATISYPFAWFSENIDVTPSKTWAS